MHFELLTVADIVIIAVILVSAVLAFLRGFVHEALSLAGWVAAVFSTFYGFNLLRPYMGALIGAGMVADGLTAVAIFVAALIVFSILARLISARVRDSALSGADRLLGAVFGTARGLLVVALAYLAVSWIWPVTEQPGWVRNARARPVLEATVEALRWLAPEQSAEIRAVAPGAKSGNATARPAAPPQEKGYNLEERRQLDRILEGIR